MAWVPFDWQMGPVIVNRLLYAEVATVDDATLIHQGGEVTATGCLRDEVRIRGYIE